jgi:tripartite-type tricarboxylate transporter receptor subunit TctC
LLQVAIVAVLFLLEAHAVAQTKFPTQSITIYAGWEPGGSGDLTMKIMAKRATELLKRAVIIENKPGGGQYVAHAIVYKAKPDGHTLIVNVSSLMVLTPHLREAPYKPLELTPIMSYGTLPLMLSVRSEAPWKTMKEFIKYAKDNPRKVSLALTQPDSMGKIAMSLLEEEEKIEFKYVPFEGAAPAFASTFGGHTDAYVGTGDAVQFIKEGRMRGLATFLGQRIQSIPDTPTLKDLGYNIVVESRFGIYGPPKVRKDIVEKLQNTLKQTMDDEDLKKVAERFEVTLSYLSSDQLGEYDRNLSDRVKKTLIRIGRIKE